MSAAIFRRTPPIITETLLFVFEGNHHLNRGVRTVPSEFTTHTRPLNMLTALLDMAAANVNNDGLVWYNNPGYGIVNASSYQIEDLNLFAQSISGLVYLTETEFIARFVEFYGVAPY